MNDFDMNDLNIGDLNNAIQNVGKISECGPECQTENTKQALELAYKKAQDNVINAPQQLFDAEKDYYIKVKGLTDYNDMLTKRYLDEINTSNENERIKVSQQKYQIIKIINEYKTSLIYLEKMEELNDKLQEENDKYKKDIDIYISNNNTSNRKAFYTENQLTSIETWNTFFKVIYVMIFIALTIKLLYIEKLYENKFTWIVLFLLILLPYLFIPILSKIIQLLYDWSSNKDDKSMIIILKNIITIITNEMKILSGAVMYPFETLYNLI